MSSRPLVVAGLWLVAACSEPPSSADAGVADTSPRPADARSPADAAIDSAERVDATAPIEMDAGDDASAAVSSDASGEPPPNDAGAPDGGSRDAPSGPRVIGVRVLADAACSELSFDPPMISVPAGTSFTVNWINATGCTEIDIDKDGTVPIVIGLPPGASHHDTVREWCGSLFTGTFFFRAYYAPSFPFYLDVDCAG